MMLCEDLLGVRSWTHIVEPGTEIPEDRLAELEDDVRRMSCGEPVQYVIGEADFFGRRFKVNPSVLIPRPETEMLVNEAVTSAMTADRPVRVLDLCTGSGCIAWSIALEVRDSEVVAVDISDAALETASSQFDESKPLFVKADVLDTEQDFPYGAFDFVVSNPPYIMEKEKAQMRINVLEHEPALALFVPDDDPLVFYRAVARWAQRFLVPGGTGLVEINEQLPEETAAVFKDAGMTDVSVISDYSGKSRIVRFRKPAV